ncbi:hypothetical protein QYE76_040412 [Lolium multiflorum]|uniref:Uncharacterized protein n=1 Tax=Lolium multiflorum TaxID=4521 RepID=A0AAD8WT74_LOLMU|nr:hypothetical protein QYE76_040412 [Lolium multiflorum]
MEKDLAELKAQGALVADSIKAMNETLRNLSGWMPQVDTSITTIQKSIDEVASRVTALEAMRSPDEDQTPRPDGHRLRNNIQGPDSDAIRAPFHALVKDLDSQNKHLHIRSKRSGLQRGKPGILSSKGVP